MDPLPSSDAVLSPDADATPADQLADRLADEIAASWQRGQPLRAEDLLAAHPELYERPRAAVRLVYEDFCQRQSSGQEVSAGELHARFPELRHELDVLLKCHHLLDLTPRAPAVPAAGDVLGEFRLLAELGRGALGRVFLAEQSFLAGRLVVVKVTPRAGREHLTLARLQHTHIVPLYAVREFPERDLRALCMPCLGGTTLDRVLHRLGDTTPSRRSGSDLRQALTEGVADPRMYWPGRGSSWKFLEQASYTEAICWAGLCVAEALHHAREQGLVHLDLKPSNLLLTADGQPMLLDFHLAREPVPAGSRAPAWLGGTPAYMSPEQRSAWQSIQRGEAVPAAVDGRSDVYSLGLVLAEALGGGPPGAADAPSLQGRCLGHLSTGLRDILAKALQTNPERRYSGAAVLAEDLRRHLTDRPLAAVHNRNPVERWAKWRRRRPHTLAVSGLLIAVAAAVAALAGLAFLNARQRSAEAESSLQSAKGHLARHEYASATADLERAARLLANDLAPDDRISEVRRGLRQAARGQAARALHARVDRLRYAYAEDSLPPDSLRALDRFCRETWAAREDLFEARESALDEAEEEQLRTDLLDVAILWADLRNNAAVPEEAEVARREAVAVVAEAEALFGHSAVLTREKRARGNPTGAGDPEPRTAREHYAVGRWLLRSGDLDAAERELERAVAMRPGEFWPWFWRGLCAYRRHGYDDAITFFSVCVALAPDSAKCYYNRALANAARGNLERARADYDRALELEPGLSAAALNRGVLSLRQRRLAEATADLERALTLGADPAAVHFNLALVHQARHDTPAALTSVERALRYRADHSDARELRSRLLSARP
jgi:serine/threonine protein kinase/Flp pilus assembly protein TadD